MAYYLNDNFDKIYNRQGVKLIIDYLNEDIVELMIEMRYVGTPDEVMLIQTLSSITGRSDRSRYSNIVSFYPHTKQIMINPHFVDGVSVSQRVVDFVNTIPQQLRSKKIEAIIGTI